MCKQVKLSDILEQGNLFRDFCLNYVSHAAVLYQSFFVYRIEALPTLAKFLASKDSMRKGPFNNLVASWGGKAF